MPPRSASFPVVLRKKALGSEHPFMATQRCPGHVRSVSWVGMVTAPGSRHSRCYPLGSQVESLVVFHTVLSDPASLKGTRALLLFLR